ncbi:MAG: hypothetical protein Q4G49_10340 [Paracoccus sp. (in: a-proteobacteria)]|nr:hypothetical protein [Paracoccus sp. (in: a-proteobacteria)]
MNETVLRSGALASMNRASTIITVLSVALFVLGGLAFTMLHPAEIARIGGFDETAHFGAGPGTVSGYFLGDTAPTIGFNLALKMFNPGPPALWALLVMVWIALSAYGLKLVYQRWHYERTMKGRQARRLPRGAAGPPLPSQFMMAQRDDHTPTELAPLTAALIAGAAWPWVTVNHPVSGLVLAVVMLIAALGAVIRGQRDGRRIRQSLAVGLFAGWATVAGYTALAGFTTAHLGIGGDLAGLTALLLCAGTGATVQWMIRGTGSYSVGMIWALIGIAAATMTTAPTIAIGAILGITAMTAVLVRAVS